LFISQKENLQAFFKVLKDLEANKYKNVSILYFADTKAEILFPAELEYWGTTLNWNVTVALKDEKPQGKIFVKGSIYTPNSFEALPKPSSRIDVFGCVPQLSMITIADALDKLGWNTKNFRWLS